MLPTMKTKLSIFNSRNAWDRIEEDWGKSWAFIPSYYTFTQPIIITSGRREVLPRHAAFSSFQDEFPGIGALISLYGLRIITLLFSLKRLSLPHDLLLLTPISTRTKLLTDLFPGIQPQRCRASIELLNYPSTRHVPKEQMTNARCAQRNSWKPNSLYNQSNLQ